MNKRTRSKARYRTARRRKERRQRVCPNLLKGQWCPECGAQYICRLPELPKAKVRLNERRRLRLYAELATLVARHIAYETRAEVIAEDRALHRMLMRA